MIFDRVKKIISGESGIDADEIQINSTFDELDIDSLDVIDILFAVEEEFDIDIPDYIARKWTTVGDMVEYVRDNA